MNPLRWVSFWSTGELGIRDYNLTILVWRRSILYFFDCHAFLKVKQRLLSQPLFLCWHRAIFPVRRQTSIVATDELNFRVRNGNGWTLIVIGTNFVEIDLTGFVSAVTVSAAKTRVRSVVSPLQIESLDSI